MKLIERDTPERKKTIVTAIAKMFKSQKADFTKHGFDSNWTLASLTLRMYLSFVALGLCIINDNAVFDESVFE